MLILLLLGTGIAVHAGKPQSALPYQKPGAPIRLAEPDFIQMDAYRERPVAISFMTPFRGALYLTAKPNQGISLTEVPDQWQFDLSDGQPRVEFTVVSRARGLHHIMFHARMEYQGISSSRVFGIPVYVGEEEAVSTKSYPDRVIMHAEETVLPKSSL